MALPSFGADFFDAPFVSNIAFVPRKTARTGRNDDRVREGVLVVGGAELGWCLFGRGGEAVPPEAPVVFYCHANAEVAADVEHIAAVFFQAGAAACLAIDYRGYGWSTGSPTFSTLLSDMSKVAAELPALLATLQLADRPRVAYGRSLGAACAVHVVSLVPVRAPRTRRAARARPMTTRTPTSQSGACPPTRV
jgi:alpha-beta hydrolase superfamily lysophospholipase